MEGCFSHKSLASHWPVKISWLVNQSKSLTGQWLVNQSLIPSPNIHHRKNIEVVRERPRRYDRWGGYFWAVHTWKATRLCPLAFHSKYCSEELFSVWPSYIIFLTSFSWAIKKHFRVIPLFIDERIGGKSSRLVVGEKKSWGENVECSDTVAHF